MTTRSPYLYKDAAAAVEIRKREDATNWTRTPATLGAYISRGAYERVRHIDFLAERIAEIAFRPVFLVINVPPQHGKLISDDTPVMTNKGWKKHGQLKRGDYVYGRNGQPVKVLAIHKEGEANFRVHFNDGSVIDVHAKHEWLVYDRNNHKWHKYETEYMFSQKLYSGEIGRRGSRYRFQVDSNVPLFQPWQELPIHPYVLGAWLGDGSTSKNCITYQSSDIRIKEKIVYCGYAETGHSIHKLTGVHTSYFRTLYAPLKKNGLLGNKHIPDIYLKASLEQRLELLAGLIDTDGSCERGRIRIVTADIALAEQIKELILSVGYKVGIQIAEPIISSSGITGRRRVFTLSFNHAYEIPVVLERKKAKRTNYHPRKRAITGIEQIIPIKGRCITVEGGIYLVGKSFIPTCNSELVSHWTPVWFLKRFPWKKVGLASYEMSFASEWGGKAKETITDNVDELALELTKDTKAKGRWRLRGYGGGMSTAGIGGPFTGRGFDLIIIDDPIKNDAEALSEVYRRRNWNWYRSVVRPRLQPGGSIILIMTRWHEQDLAGALLGNPPEELEEGFIEEDVAPDPWEVINLPALAEDGDVLGRKPGEALWPARYDETALKRSRMAAGPFWWTAQYRGKPQPEGGGIIKTSWFKSYSEEDLPATFSTIVQIWDTAYKEKQRHDRSACLTIGKARNPTRYYLLDLFVRRMDFPELVRSCQANYDKWEPDRVLIEDKASGISLIQQLRRDTTVPMRAVKAVDDKVTRAHTVTGIMEAGQVLIPVRAPWLAEFLKEVGDFPTGAHDDIVDVLVHGLRFLKARLKGLYRGGVETEPKTSRWHE